MHVLGRGDGEGPVGHLGHYRARDGSAGADVRFDVDRPHAMLVVGKRGYGKSHTLGVVAEECTATPGVTPVVVDPVGSLCGLGQVGTVVGRPTVRADAIPPRAWPALVGLDPRAPAGTVVWQAASATGTLAGIRGYVDDSEADDTARRGATNHLRLAASWEVFDPEGLDARRLVSEPLTVLDCSALAPGARDAVMYATASGLYEARVRGMLDTLPWLLVDEAHVAFDGVTKSALETILTRGRAPGVSLVCATQRPGALPAVALSQSDLVVSHRLTASADVDALTRCQATYVDGTLRERLPTGRGEALVVDDRTESVHVVRVRERETPHRGASPRASRLTTDIDDGGGRDR